MRIIFFPLLVILSFCPVLNAHDGDDHHHEESEEHWLNQLGISIEMVENRVIRGRDVIAIPINSVITIDGRFFVMAVSEHDQSKLERWEVKLGDWDNQYVEARTGVFPGDHVVLKNLHQHFEPQPQPGYTSHEPVYLQQPVHSHEQHHHQAQPTYYICPHGNLHRIQPRSHVHRH